MRIRKRWLPFFIGLVFLIGVVLLGLFRLNNDEQVDSSLFQGGRGASFTRSLIEHAGWKTKTWDRPLVELTAQPSIILFFLEPTRFYPRESHLENRDALLTLLRKGSIIVAADRRAEWDAPNQGTMGFYYFSDYLQEEFTGLFDTFSAKRTLKDVFRPARVTPLKVPDHPDWIVETAELTPPFWRGGKVSPLLITPGDRALMVRVQVGHGVLYYSLSTAWLENRFMGSSSNQNGVFLLNLLNKDDPNHVKTVFFDEYHHGYWNRERPPASINRVSTTYRWFWWYTVGLFSLALYTLSRKPAPPPPMPKGDTPSGAEFLNQVAGLMNRSNLDSEASESLQRYVEYLWNRYRNKIQWDADLMAEKKKTERLFRQAQTSIIVWAHSAVHWTRKLEPHATGKSEK